MRRTRAVWTSGFFFVFGAFPAKAQQQPSTPAPPAPSPVFENRGKPILVPYACSADDIQWAGLSCAEDEPCAVFLELSGAEASGNRTLIAGNLHAESVTLSSVLLASDDDGRTWSEVHPRMRGAALDHIQFLDAATGWISGEELFPLPQNPFLLLTTDGGKTWSRRPVPNDTAEDRFGVVQQFAFADKDTGSLIVDRGPSGVGYRYVLYESRTGGESWNIVEESTRQPHLRQSAPASSWRVRVDAPTSSFHVEHRQGDRWSPVAAFAVKLEPCK
jgi:photosystem II stability/assembly factor-like uncharacterized protein